MSDTYRTLCDNIHALLVAEPARVTVDQLDAIADSLDVPLSALFSPDFDVETVPWLPCLEIVESA